MKFEAAATLPGFANSSQKGTEPSAKSIQTGFLDGREQASVAAALGAVGRAEAVTPATTTKSTNGKTLFTPVTLSSRKWRSRAGGGTSRFPQTLPLVRFADKSHAAATQPLRLVQR